jgi:hypothetical protein
MPSVRQTAEVFSQKEGVSLNTFINVAVAEKLAHLQHEEWIRRRRPFTPELAERAMALLDKNHGRPVEPGDELPEGYVSVRNRK